MNTNRDAGMNGTWAGANPASAAQLSAFLGAQGSYGVVNTEPTAQASIKIGTAPIGIYTWNSNSQAYGVNQSGRGNAWNTSTQGWLPGTAGTGGFVSVPVTLAYHQFFTGGTSFGGGSGGLVDPSPDFNTSYPPNCGIGGRSYVSIEF
ncbi:hypothetical protein FACS1894185_4790 [Betaproteobacteria bacterium]|nr:hypothetical protein FACS1894185_4790 [Betaproteobacteria bacterium]